MYRLSLTTRDRLDRNVNDPADKATRRAIDWSVRPVTRLAMQGVVSNAPNGMYGTLRRMMGHV